MEYWTNEREQRGTRRPEAAQRRPRVRTNECRVASEERRERERERDVEKRAGSRRWEKEEVRETDKGTREREKDGADVKQGSLAAYSIARETCRFSVDPLPPITTSPLSFSLSLSLSLFLSVRFTFYLLSLSVSFRHDRLLRFSPSFSSSHTVSLALATVSPLSLRLVYLRS